MSFFKGDLRKNYLDLSPSGILHMVAHTNETIVKLKGRFMFGSVSQTSDLVG